MGSLGHLLWIIAGALLIVSSLRPGRAMLTGVGPVAFGIAAIAFVVSVLVFPITAYVPGGHEGLYHQLAMGEPVAPGAEGPWAILPLPTAVAWTAGWVGGRAGELAWLVLGRLALPLACLAAAAAAAEVAPSDRGRAHRAAGTAAWVLAVDPTLHAWSATGFFVAPATAAALVAFAFGVRGGTSLALGWGALAVGSRLETLPLVVTAVLLSRVVGRPVRTAPAARLGALSAVLGAASMMLRGSPPVQGGPELWDVVAANTSLPGLLLSPAMAAASGLFIVWGWLSDAGPRLDPARRRGALTLTAGTVAVFGTLIAAAPLPDGGPRHLLPALGAFAVMLGVAAGRVRPRLSGVAVATALFATQTVTWMFLVPTHAARAGGLPPLERTTVTPEALHACTLLVEGGSGPGVGPFSGAEIVEATNLDGCIAVDVPDAHVFRGDARAERLARARRLFDLAPHSLDGRLVWIGRERSR